MSPVICAYPKNEWNALLDARGGPGAARDPRRPGRDRRRIPAPGAPAAGGAAAGEMLSQVIDIAALGDNIVIPGSGSFRIRIYELSVYNVAQKTVTFWDGTTRKLHGPLPDFPAGSGYYLGDTDRPHFELTAGNSFIINLSVATQLSGFVRYRME